MTLRDDITGVTADLNLLITTYRDTRKTENIAVALDAVTTRLRVDGYTVEDLRQLVACGVLHLVQAHTTVVPVDAAHDPS